MRRCDLGFGILIAAMISGCSEGRSVVGGLDDAGSMDRPLSLDSEVTGQHEDAVGVDVFDAGRDLPRSPCDDPLPPTLECTGLYTDIVAHTVATGVRPFVPAVPLWSDGSGKNRWIALPPGQTIDRTRPTDWVFPPGTRFWKEFSRNGRRVETRFFHKQPDGRWVWVAYVWNTQETAAVAAPGGQDIPLGEGVTYHVPSQRQCNQCHEGRSDRIMGFEEVSLGMPGASGLTLAQLASEALLSPPPTRTALTLGDDGTGRAVHALGWLHINCGVSCHNDTLSAFANRSGLHLRLDPTQLDGRSPETFDAITNTVNVPASTGFWGNEDRIHPGDPDHSLIVYLLSHRGAGIQMPPLASDLVDTDDLTILREWIERMTP